MSRASGAGAYSHGMAWPSPNPQLLGCWSGVTTTLVLGAFGHGRHYVTARAGPPFSSRSRERVDALAEAHMDMVVVAGVPARQALADEHRVVEVDDLDVPGRGGPDGT